jgi:non-ribosomal peptide synthetase component F
MPAEDPSSGVTLDNAAYLVYTSGSTGQPKGAINCHRGAANFLLWQQAEFAINDQDHVLHKATLSFDMAVSECFVSLISGARLVIARPEEHKDLASLAKTITHQQVTWGVFVPSVLHALLEQPELDDCRSLKHMTVGGEALTAAVRQRFFDRLDSELYNMYGPSETAMAVSFFSCRKDQSYDVTPIGRPIANVRLYVLDEHLNPTPIGVPASCTSAVWPLAEGIWTDRN